MYLQSWLGVLAITVLHGDGVFGWVTFYLPATGNIREKGKGKNN